MRPVERDLAGLGIRCFATPTRSAARHHPFYAWMRNGMRLYAALARHYPLIRRPAPAHGRVCVETFPHGIATVLAGRPLRARTKHPDRHHILQAVGIDTAPLDSMDFLDAALCALAAHRYLRGRAQVIGDAEQGYLVLPSARLPSNQSQKLRRG
jgi:predicted RNase H-like nuclease